MKSITIPYTVDKVCKHSLRMTVDKDFTPPSDIGIIPDVYVTKDVLAHLGVPHASSAKLNVTFAA